MKARRFLLALGAFVAPAIAPADSTIAQPITRVLYNGNSDYVYYIILTDSSWNPPGTMERGGSTHIRRPP
jgi:hypothetical protein